MMDFDPLTAEIVWRVWGTPVNFNGFRILASLLHRRRSTEVKQTLHDVRLSPSLVRYIYTFWGLLPLTKFWQMQNSLCVQVLRSPILAALLHGTRVAAVSQTKLCGVVQGMELRNFRRGHHLYSAERPSRWAPAHILVYFCFFVCHSNISGTAERICAIFIGRRVWTLAWTSWNV